MNETALQYDLPEECNSNCIFCRYQYNKKNDPLNVNKNVIDKYRALNIGGLVALGGGEPLIYKYFPDLLWYIKSLNMRLSVVTNGLLINKYDQTVLQNIDYMVISLHSHKKEVYNLIRRDNSYDIVMGNINLLSKIRSEKNITLAAVLNSITIDSMYDFCLFCLDNGYNVSIPIQQRYFSENVITSDIRFLFDIDLIKLDRLLNQIIKLKMKQPIMTEEYAEKVVAHFKRVQDGILHDTKLGECICEMRMVKRYLGGWGCISGGVRAGDIEILRERIRNCPGSCGINPCVCCLLP